jgi:biopolymer transport protein ExbD
MKFRPPEPTSMTLNLAPMVDVMMCLIIFFLLASKLADAGHQPLELPWAVAAREVERSDLGARVTINVRRGADESAAEYVVVDWDGKSIQERVLAPHELETLLAGRALRAAEEKSTLACVIRADRGVMYQHVEAVLRAAGLARIQTIIFSAHAGLEPAGEGAGS